MSLRTVKKLDSTVELFGSNVPTVQAPGRDSGLVIRDSLRRHPGAERSEEPGIHSVAWRFGQKVDLFARSSRSPFGPSAAPMFTFGNPASVSGSSLRAVRDDDSGSVEE